MMDEQLFSQLTELFLETWNAHHQAFIETDGFDPEWPVWYARYLQPRLADYLGKPLTVREIVFLLVVVEEDRLRSGSTVGWTHLYAHYFLKIARLGETIDG